MAELGRALAQWLLDQDARVDACGTLVRSKWLESTSVRPDLDPAADPRGPFSATIPLKWSKSATKRRVAILACSLFGPLAAAFAFAPLEHPDVGQRPVALAVEGHERSLAAAPAPQTSGEPAVITAAARERSRLPEPVVDPVGDDGGMNERPAREPQLPATPNHRQPPSAGAPPGRATATRPSAAFPSATSSPSDLDLIAPYPWRSGGR